MRKDIRIEGFTLIELIVAISITSLIGIAAHNMLNSIMTSHQYSKQVHKNLMLLDTGLRIIKGDLQQLIPMRIHGDDFPLENNGLHVRPISEAVDTSFLEFVRGLKEPDASPTSLKYVQVRYKLIGSNLIREERPYPNTNHTAEWHAIRIFSDISNVEIEVFEKKWETLFAEYRGDKIPKALRFNFSSNLWESSDLTVLLSGSIQ